MKDKNEKNGFSETELELMSKIIDMQEHPYLNRIEENLAQITEIQKEIEEERKKTEEQRKKTEEQREKTEKEIVSLSKQVKKVDKQIGELTDGWGKFVEGLVAPSIPKVFKSLGIQVFDTSLRRTRQRNGNEMEIDVLCLGKKQDGKKLVMITEVKSNLQSNHIDEFKDRLMEFKDFFDEYKDDDIIGIVAGIRFGAGVERYAEKLGLYVLAPSGEIVKMTNKPGFIPHIWR